MPSKRADRLQTMLWVAWGLALLWLLYLLSPILAPFLLGGILAYICAPLVERLEQRRVPRIAGVLLIMLMIVAVVVLLILTLVPLVRDEAQLLAARLPDGVALWNENIVPWVRQHFGFQLRLRLDPASLKKLIGDNWENAQSILQGILPSLKIGGMALLGLLATLILAPVAMFYLLLDWNPLLRRIGNAIPRPWQARALRICGEINAVLAEFLRGQISVMLLLAVYYSAALWLAGINFALPIGILTGLLIFIPYLGFALGFALALVVALLQFEGMQPLIGVLVVYGIGQILEGFVLTPWLVGKRIGLHPLAVIFALLAFGQLFGFFGVLLALPASATLLVALREVSALYYASNLYRGDEANQNDDDIKSL
jgi:predicted PurR-regulated permease PerM